MVGGGPTGLRFRVISSWSYRLETYEDKGQVPNCPGPGSAALVLAICWKWNIPALSELSVEGAGVSALVTPRVTVVWSSPVSSLEGGEGALMLYFRKIRGWGVCTLFSSIESVTFALPLTACTWTGLAVFQ